MVDWVQSLFLWVSKQVTPWLTWIWDLLKKQSVVFLGILAGILAPISYAINYWAEATYFVYQETERMVTFAQSMQVSQGTGFWAALSGGASLMNCIVALDFAIAIGTTVFGFMMFIMIAKGLVWLYRLVPFKFS